MQDRGVLELKNRELRNRKLSNIELRNVGLKNSEKRGIQILGHNRIHRRLILQ